MLPPASRRLLTAVAVAGALSTLAALTVAAPSSAAAPTAEPSTRVDRPLVAHGVTPAVRDARRRVETEQARERENPALPDTAPAGRRDAVLQTQAAATSTTTTTPAGPGFKGLGVDDTAFRLQYAPPDTNAAVGPDRVVQTVNVMVGVYDKAGARLAAPFYGSTLMGGLASTAGARCAQRDDGDPVVQYDQAHDRWLFTQFVSDKAPYLECVAVSRSSDPLGAYDAYAYSYGTDFPDYPKVGIWPGSYVVTYNTFARGRTFNGAEVCALDREKLFARTGNPAQQCFKTSKSYSGLLPSDVDGTPPPAGSDAYVVGLSGGSLASWRLHVDWTATARTSLTGPTPVGGVASYTAPCGGACVVQPGTTQKLDALSDRLMYRLAYRNRNGTESLMVDHSVGSGSGLAPRWYELTPSMPDSGLKVAQQGTYAPDGTSRWMGSVAMNKAGDIALAYSASSGTTYPSLRWAGRPGTTTTAGQLGTELPLVTGAGSQVSLSRWGDYSSMRVDPVDDCTFWFTSEYLLSGGSFNWSTWIAPLKVSDCA